MSIRKLFNSRILGGAAAAAIIVGGMAATPASANAAPIQFEIARQSLGSALNQLALRFDRQLVLESGLVRNRTTAGLKGQYTLEQALDRLLVGTGLNYAIKGNTVIIRKAGAGRFIPVSARSEQASAMSVQDGEPLPAGAVVESAAEEPIIVTGSRIARTGYDTPQPVTAIDSLAIESTGVSNIADVLTRSPVVGVGLGQANSYYNSDAGASFINLRGLGTNRTLVLVNGRRRVAGTGRSSAVDLTTIPANMVERIEVITGGASAVYGADAVTGVVNITLKSDVQGVELSGRSGISSRGDGESYSLGALVGSDFADGRGKVVLGASYNREHLLMANKREFGRNQVELFSNPDNTGPNDGIYDSIAIANYRYTGTTYGGTYNIGDTAYTYDENGVRPLQNDQRVSFWGVGGDGFDDADFRPLRNGSKVFAATTHLEYEISDRIGLFADAQYARTKTEAPLQPSFDLGGDFTLTYDNPLIPDDVRALMDDAGMTELTFGRTNWDQGQQVRYVDRDTVTGVVGLEGKIGRFDWLGFYQYGRYEADSKVTHNRITSRFMQALDVVDGVDGPVCRDAAAVAAGCVPLSVFGSNAASPDAVAYFDYTKRRKVVNTQQVAGLQLNGDLFDLPDGAVQIALGAEYRKETTKAVPDPLSAMGELWRDTDNPVDASFDVKEVFGEVLVPILSGRRFAEELSLEGAVRFSDYNTIGTTTTWKLGAQWAPVNDIRFRVTRSRSVRAPNLAELYSAGSVSNVFIIDPCNAATIDLGSTNRAANCAALGLASGYSDPEANAFKFVVTSGNPDVNEETSNSWTAGAVITPTFLSGFSASVDWWKIDLSGAIGTVSEQRLVDDCVDASTIDNPFCSQIARKGNGAIGSINVAPINIGSQNAEGIDFGATYRTPIGAADLRFNVSGTYLIKNELEVVSGDPTTLDVSRGEVDNPDWRVNFTPGITAGPFSLDWTVRYIDSSKVDVQLSDEGRSDNKVSSKLYNDIYAALEVTDRMNFYAGVNNLFDVDPPFSRETYQGSARGALFDNIGRYLYVGVNASF